MNVFVIGASALMILVTVVVTVMVIVSIVLEGVFG